MAPYYKVTFEWIDTALKECHRMICYYDTVDKLEEEIPKWKENDFTVEEIQQTTEKGNDSYRNIDLVSGEEWGNEDG